MTSPFGCCSTGSGNSGGDRCDRAGWAAVGWDAVGWAAVGWDAVGWDAVGWAAVGWDRGGWGGQKTGFGE
jgi:hypothetical protein